MIFGYARVSTAEQKLETQIELLKQQGCEKIYTDIASGVREDRKGLNEMLSFLREGDVVIVYKTDRIFRSLKNWKKGAQGLIYQAPPKGSTVGHIDIIYGGGKTGSGYYSASEIWYWPIK